MVSVGYAPRIQYVDENGAPRVGMKLYTYATGTATPVATYANSGLTVSHSNPIIADANGVLPAIYPDPALGALKYRFFSATDVNLGLDTDPAYSPPVAATPAEIGAALYPLSDAEDAAGVTPVSFFYPYGDLRRYGSAGDGITDDTTAAQRAANSNGYVFGHPEDTYLISTLALASNQTFDGRGANFKQAVSAEWVNAFSIISKTNVKVRNCRIDGNGNAQPAGEHKHGVYVFESTDVLVENNTIHDCQGDAVYVSSVVDPVTCQRVTVRQNTIYNLGRQGITAAGHGVRSFAVLDNEIRVGTYVTPSTSHGNAIHLEIDTTPTNYIGDVLVRGNRCFESGITFSGIWSNIAINGNVIRNPKYGNFAIGGVNFGTVNISGNAVYGDNATVVDAILIQDAPSGGSPVVKNVTVIGNTIEDIAGHGINILGTGNGVPSLGQLTIHSNTLRRIGTGGTKNGIFVATPFPDASLVGNNIKTVTNIGIVFQASANFLIAANKIGECAGAYGIYLGSNTTGVGPGLVTGNYLSWATPAGKTGIGLESSASNTGVTIIANDCGRAATPVLLGGAAVKSSSLMNVGGDASLTGSFTLSAAATKVVTNANVTATCRIRWMATNAAAATLMGGAKSLYVSARTAGTSFTLATADATNAAGTETFEYEISV